MMSVGFEVLIAVTTKGSICGSKIATFFSLVYFLSTSSTVKMGALYSCEMTTDFSRT
jgi:hypothetical protein